MSCNFAISPSVFICANPVLNFFVTSIVYVLVVSPSSAKTSIVNEFIWLMSIDLFSILFGVYSVSVPNFILAFSSFVIASIASVCSLSSTCTSYVDDVIFETFLMSFPFISAISVLLDSFSIFSISAFVVPSSAVTLILATVSLPVKVIFPSPDTVALLWLVAPSNFIVVAVEGTVTVFDFVFAL